jgi:hypothetical protein
MRHGVSALSQVHEVEGALGAVDVVYRHPTTAP